MLDVLNEIYGLTLVVEECIKKGDTQLSLITLATLKEIVRTAEDELMSEE